MDVQVGYALAYPVVDRHKRSLGPHSRLDRARKPLSGGEQRLNPLPRQIGESLVMRFGDQEAMTRKHRPMIQEGQRVFVLENDQARNLLRHDPAECATADLRHSQILPHA